MEELKSPTPPPHKTFVESGSNGASSTSTAEGFKAAGNKFFRMRAYDQAIQEYTKAIQADSQNPVYLSNRSAALMSAHRYVEALQDAKIASQMDPGNGKILLRVARIYTALGQPSEAMEAFNRIEPPVTEKDRAPTDTMLGYIQQAEACLREASGASFVIHALGQAEKGLGQGARPPRRWQILRGEAYLRIGSARAVSDALDLATSMLRDNSQDPDALVLRGMALYAHGENDKALQHFRQALGYDPDMKSAITYLRMIQKIEKLKKDGNAAFNAGRNEDAIGLYGAALEVDTSNKSTNSRILQNRALAALRVC